MSNKLNPGPTPEVVYAIDIKGLSDKTVRINISDPENLDTAIDLLLFGLNTLNQMRNQGQRQLVQPVNLVDTAASDYIRSVRR